MNVFLLVLTVILSACTSSDNPDLGPRQTIGSISFQNVPNFTSEDDGQGGVYLGSPDAEITIVMLYVPSSMFTADMAPRSIGARYPEERFPFEFLLILGFEQEIELGDYVDYEHDGNLGYSRHFTASSIGGDPIEGEYVVYDVGDYVFIGMGSVVHVTGANDWFPEGKIAYDLIIDSVHIKP
jgi:hypothetical protein